MLGINGKENNKTKRKRKVKRRKKKAMIEKIQFYNFHLKDLFVSSLKEWLQKIKIINSVEEGGRTKQGSIITINLSSFGLFVGKQDLNRAFFS